VTAIDLNGDVGGSEGARSPADEEAVLDLVTSANVACDLDADRPSTLRRVCRAAADRSVTIGARVSYPDPSGSGRGCVAIDPAALRDAVLYQLGALDGFAQVAGAGVGYLKPHGALYDACIRDPDLAEAVAEAAHEFDPALAVLGAPGSPLLAVADALGMEPVEEAFAHRTYLADGRLTPTTRPGAVITDPATIADRAVAIATHRRLVTADGTEVSTCARSICIDGGSPSSVALGEVIRAGLERASVGVHAFAV
jgi:UPF0271 protein